MKLRSGRHIGIIRSWIQSVASNGEHVTWESNDPVNHSTKSVIEYEMLAQRIAYAAQKEVLRHLNICDNYESAGFAAEADEDSSIFHCKGCGFHRDLHELKSDNWYNH